MEKDIIHVERPFTVNSQKALFMTLFLNCSSFSLLKCHGATVLFY